MSEPQEIQEDNSKTIFRVIKDKENPFVMIDRRVLENPVLSWKAKGLLAYLLSRPDNWKIIMGDLIKRSTDGEHSTRAALMELIKARHVHRTDERDEAQRFVRFVYEVHEKPLPENQEMGSGKPFPEKPKVEKPKVENRSLNNTNNNDKEVNLAATAADEHQRGMTNPNSGNRTDAVVQGDPMDGLLFGARLAADQGNQLVSRVQEYPQDCQQTLTWFVEVFGWPVGSIPSRPIRGKQGGAYAQWINELRDINQVISGFGKEAIQAVKAPCQKLSISHPAAVMWALPAEVGKLAQRQQRQENSAATVPYNGALDNFNPAPRPSRESLGLQPAAWERQA